jgi:hypothetical protein
MLDDGSNNQQSIINLPLPCTGLKYSYFAKLFNYSTGIHVYAFLCTRPLKFMIKHTKKGVNCPVSAYI